MSKNFAVVGVAGYIAPRHLKAIEDTGNVLVAATDPSDSVGVLDRHSFEVKFFKETERFDRHLDKLRRRSEHERVHYVSICSPNYLHDAHIRLALRNQADAICEKPLVVSPWNLDSLQSVEKETGHRVFTILQLRVHPQLLELKQRLERDNSGKTHDVTLSYITSRGPWYHVSWKGSEEHSGGIATNIGIHFFDLLLWLYGPLVRHEVHVREPKRMGGFLELKRARVRWFLSVDREDLHFVPEKGRPATFRSIQDNGHEIEFTEGFTDLHTRVYQHTLEGRGFGIDDARPSVELAYALRTSPVTAPSPDTVHPALVSKGTVR